MLLSPWSREVTTLNETDMAKTNNYEIGKKAT